MTQANRFTQTPEPFLREGFIETERTRGVSYEMFKDLYDSFNNHIREVAAANNVVLIDLAASIPQHQDYIYDAVHLTLMAAKRSPSWLRKRWGRSWWAINASHEKRGSKNLLIMLK